MRPFLETYPYGSQRAALAPPASDATIAVALAPGVARSLALPVGARFVALSFTGDVWVRFGNAGVTAAAPAGVTADGTAPELNPDARRIPDDATHVALLAEAAAKGSLAFWS
jgi:hypothetical protein